MQISISRFSLIVFAAYLLMGSIPRFISFNGSSLPINELLLYFYFSILFFLIPNTYIRVLKNIAPIILIILSSYLYGLLLHGFDMKSLYYVLRTIFQIMIGILVGYHIYDFYKDKIKNFIDDYLNLYLIISLISIVILIFFPHAYDFYKFLENFGINFYADPQVNRLISVYLDPNLFAMIVSLPIFFIVTELFNRFRLRSMYLLIFFSICLFLTFSRSGIASFLLLFFIYSLIYFIKSVFYTKRVRINSLYLIAFISVAGFIFLSGFVILSFDQIIERLSDPISQDASGLLRLESSLIGINSILENPLFGVGYNYGYIVSEARTLVSEHAGVQSGFDSSILTIIVNFGLIPSIVLFFFIFRAIISVKTNSQDLLLYWIPLKIYLFVVAIFYSQLNNILFFQFWLIPIISLCTYMYLISINKNDFN